jgi:hypothetical protein
MGNKYLHEALLLTVVQSISSVYVSPCININLSHTESLATVQRDPTIAAPAVVSDSQNERINLSGVWLYNYADLSCLELDFLEQFWKSTMPLTQTITMNSDFTAVRLVLQADSFDYDDTYEIDGPETTLLEGKVSPFACTYLS